MRIDIMKNTKAIVQSEKRRSIRRWIVFAGIVLGMGYICILLTTYVLKPGDASDQAMVNKFEESVVHLDASTNGLPSFTAPKTIITYRSNYRPAGLVHHDVKPVNPVTSSPKQTMNSRAVTVHTTSSATVHNVGSGVSGSTAAKTITSDVSSSVPFSMSTSNIVMPTAVWTSSRALSVQNTRQSEQQLIATNSAENATTHHGTIRRVDNDPLDPFLDPIGDGLWILLMAAVVYAGAVLIHRRKQQAK